MLKKTEKISMNFTKWISDLDWRLLFLIIPPFSLIVFLSLSSAPTNPFASFVPVQSFILGRATSQQQANIHSISVNPSNYPASSSDDVLTPNGSAYTRSTWRRRRKDELDRSRMAVCLVGGARRFELTGPSIVQRILMEYPNSDLFLHSPMDQNAFKFSLLKKAPRLASVRIFVPKTMPETESQVRVLSAKNSPNGIQGLLQYFNLVEGCLTMIQNYQKQNDFVYDWIVRTRVDGYWNGPLHPKHFIPGQYLVPPGSTYGGLNDRLGIGDLNTSIVALSRLSLIPELDSAGFSQLNSETAFKAQLTTKGVAYQAKRLPFCVVTDRKYGFPPSRYGVPVAALSSTGPLSGAKCRPCTPICREPCVANVMLGLDRGWSWTNWGNGTLELCDAHDNWEMGWEKIFDSVAGKKLASERKRVRGLTMKQCIDDFNQMQRRTSNWEAPPVEEICRLGARPS